MQYINILIIDTIIETKIIIDQNARSLDRYILRMSYTQLLLNVSKEIYNISSGRAFEHSSVARIRQFA